MKGRVWFSGLVTALALAGFAGAALARTPVNATSTPGTTRAQASPAPAPTTPASPAPAQSPGPAPSPAATPAPKQIVIPSEVQGELKQGTSAVLRSDGSLYDAYTFDGKQGQTITIRMESSQFDTYLGLLDPEGKIIGENDDAQQGSNNSAIQVTLPADGKYTIIANGYDRSSQGAYTLRVSTAQ